MEYLRRIGVNSLKRCISTSVYTFRVCRKCSMSLTFEKFFLQADSCMPTKPANSSSIFGVVLAEEHFSLWAATLHSKGARLMPGQGHYLSIEEIRKIVHLLSSTEMALNEIADRMSCSKSAIATVNRKFNVRTYNGLRSRWSNAEVPQKR